MKNKLKQIPNYDITEFIKTVSNPEVERIEKAKEEIILVSRKEVNNNGND